VREGRAKALERLSSYREPSSRNPRTSHARDPGLEALCPRTVSPSLHPCPASGGASGFLQASAPGFHHETLRSHGAQDARCVQSTSATQTTCVHPYLVAFPARSRGFRRVDTPRSLRLRAARPGNRTFHDVRLASADRHRTRTSCLVPSSTVARSRAWAFCSHGVRCDRTSDTPVASPSSTSRSRAFARANRSRRGSPDHGRVGGGKEPPRSGSPPPRER